MNSMNKELSEAEDRVQNARSALDEARSATKEAEAAYRQRQAEEDAKLEVYEREIGKARDLFATRRRRLEDQKRQAEEELHALESKLEGLKAANEPRIDPVKVDLSSTQPNGAGAGSEAGFDGDWYQKLLLEAETDKPEKGE